jgi:hypothetical protein
MMRVVLATEDELSETIGQRLIESSGHLQVCQTLRKQGFGYLKSNMPKFREISRHTPLLLLTDLDRAECAPSLIKDWLGGRKLEPGLLFRVAVRETESWLLADKEAMAELLKLGVSRLPANPDTLQDPKAKLLQLVREGKNRSLKNDLLPSPGSTSKIGLGYNAVLSHFVRTRWCGERAAQNSPSLAKARRRIDELADSAK